MHSFISFLGSSALHAAALVALSSFAGAYLQEKIRPVPVELISTAAPAVLPKKEISPQVPQRKFIRPVVKNEAEITKADSTPAPAPVADSSPPSELPMGETDVDAILQGRAPRNAVEAYLAKLRERIALKQKYPKLSEVQEEEGVVRIRFRVHSDGTIGETEIITPSPFRRLNEAAVKAVQDAFPFAPFPPELKNSSWLLVIPVRFALSKH